MFISENTKNDPEPNESCDVSTYIEAINEYITNNIDNQDSISNLISKFLEIKSLYMTHGISEYDIFIKNGFLYTCIDNIGNIKLRKCSSFCLDMLCDFIEKNPIYIKNIIDRSIERHLIVYIDIVLTDETYLSEETDEFKIKITKLSKILAEKSSDFAKRSAEFLSKRIFNLWMESKQKVMNGNFYCYALEQIIKNCLSYFRSLLLHTNSKDKYSCILKECFDMINMNIAVMDSITCLYDLITLNSDFMYYFTEANGQELFMKYLFHSNSDRNAKNVIIKFFINNTDIIKDYIDDVFSILDGKEDDLYVNSLNLISDLISRYHYDNNIYEKIMDLSISILSLSNFYSVIFAASKMLFAVLQSSNNLNIDVHMDYVYIALTYLKEKESYIPCILQTLDILFKNNLIQQSNICENVFQILCDLTKSEEYCDSVSSFINKYFSK